MSVTRESAFCNQHSRTVQVLGQVGRFVLSINQKVLILYITISANTVRFSDSGSLGLLYSLPSRRETKPWPSQLAAEIGKSCALVQAFWCISVTVVWAGGRRVSPPVGRVNSKSDTILRQLVRRIQTESQVGKRHCDCSETKKVEENE